MTDKSTNVSNTNANLLDSSSKLLSLYEKFYKGDLKKTSDIKIQKKNIARILTIVNKERKNG